jgi:ABC-type polysaccharide/polyol phosphate export permease
VTAVISIWGQRELLWNLTLRELRTKYRRSFLGWAWSMINPLMTVLIFSFVFKVLFNAVAPVGDPSGISSYAVYLLSGLIPWGFFSLITNVGMSAVAGNPGLVRKVAFSKEILVFAQVLFSMVQFSIEMGIVLVVVSVAGGWVLPWIPAVIGLMALLAVFGAGFALALSVFVVYFRDMNYLWTIIMQVLFYATPIVYSDQLVEERVSGLPQFVLSNSPFAVFIKSFRHLLYDGRLPSWGMWLYLLVVTIFSLSMGLLIFNKMSRRLPEEV